MDAASLFPCLANASPSALADRVLASRGIPSKGPTIEECAPWFGCSPDDLHKKVAAMMQRAEPTRGALVKLINEGFPSSDPLVRPTLPLVVLEPRDLRVHVGDGSGRWSTTEFKLHDPACQRGRNLPQTPADRVRTERMRHVCMLLQCCSSVARMELVNPVEYQQWERVTLRNFFVAKQLDHEGVQALLMLVDEQPTLELPAMQLLSTVAWEPSVHWVGGMADALRARQPQLQPGQEFLPDTDVRAICLDILVRASPSLRDLKVAEERMQRARDSDDDDDDNDVDEDMYVKDEEEAAASRKRPRTPDVEDEDDEEAASQKKPRTCAILGFLRQLEQDELLTSAQRYALEKLVVIQGDAMVPAYFEAHAGHPADFAACCLDHLKSTSNDATKTK